MSNPPPAPPLRRCIRARLILLFSATALTVFISLYALPFAWRSDPPSLPAHALFESLVRASFAAGEEIVRLRGVAGGADGRYADGSVELHTEADARSAAIFARVGHAFPGLLVINEESVAAGVPMRAVAGADGDAGGGLRVTHHGAHARGARWPLAELVVWIDPLDATAEYSAGLDAFVTLSACVARRGVPIIGIVYQPFENRLYWTSAGTGANVAFDVEAAVSAERSRETRETAWGDGGESGGGGGRRGGCACASARGAQSARGNVTLSKDGARVVSDGLRVVVSRAHGESDGEVGLGVALARAADAAVAGAHAPVLTPAGGAGYKILELVEGRADVYAHRRGIRKWDLCAGDALLRAAGGGLTDWGGEPICYCAPAGLEAIHVSGVLAAARADVHTALSSALDGGREAAG